MRALIQRVKQAKVEIDTETVGSIGPGILVFLGIAPRDTLKEAQFLVGKIAKLRIFPDQADLMNLSVQQVEGDILVVSQFTLYGDCSKGNRPSFTLAAKPDHAIPLYQAFVNRMQTEIGKPIATGRFGADMRVSLTNWGPVTMLLEAEAP